MKRAYRNVLFAAGTLGMAGGLATIVHAGFRNDDYFINTSKTPALESELYQENMKIDSLNEELNRPLTLNNQYTDEQRMTRASEIRDEIDQRKENITLLNAKLSGTKIDDSRYTSGCDAEGVVGLFGMALSFGLIEFTKRKKIS